LALSAISSAHWPISETGHTTRVALQAADKRQLEHIHLPESMLSSALNKTTNPGPL